LKRFATGLVSGLLNGLLGSGGGAVVVLALQKFLKVDTHKSHATAVAIMLPLTLVSAAIYLMLYETNIMMALWVTLGGVFGGILGAKFLRKISAKWLHKLFGAVMIFAAVRMLI
jgi:uncharacterized membrane protein YfcA